MLQVTKLIGLAGSGKSVALQAIHDAMTSQGRQCLAISGGGQVANTMRAITIYAAGQSDRFPLVILLDDANDDLVARIRALVSKPGFLYAAIR